MKDFSKLERYMDKYGAAGKTPEDKEYFAAAVGIALNEYNLDVGGCVDEFGVSRATVKRWAIGVAVPHPVVRKSILEWIVDEISES